MEDNEQVYKQIINVLRVSSSEMELVVGKFNHQRLTKDDLRSGFWEQVILAYQTSYEDTYFGLGEEELADNLVTRPKELPDPNKAKDVWCFLVDAYKLGSCLGSLNGLLDRNDRHQYYQPEPEEIIANAQQFLASMSY